MCKKLHVQPRWEVLPPCLDYFLLAIFGNCITQVFPAGSVFVTLINTIKVHNYIFYIHYLNTNNCLKVVLRQCIWYIKKIYQYLLNYQHQNYDDDTLIITVSEHNRYNIAY